jgi:23S rRNA (guanine2445-N2)-methyltransferase / 23S rRNA (guanine2069-N7)-methyltransferase
MKLGTFDRLGERAQMLGNRVAKNARHLARWAKREAVSCYRLYDCDIPELPIAIDRYEDALVIADCRLPARADHGEDTDPAHRAAWLGAMVEASGRALGVVAADVFVKERQPLRERQLGHQYERLGDRAAWREVSEAGHRFRINLSDYLDTGLFLDHRLTRKRVAAEPGAHSMLNLFCYTGAFSVYCGAAGMTTTSVDLSTTYLDWARTNLELNHLDPAAHTLIRGDVRDVLDDLLRRGQRFDLAVVDPPTFSNSKRMTTTWEVERDHAELLAQVTKVVRPGGVLWFSTNRRRFTLDPDLASRLPRRAKIEDLSAATIPLDFRDPHIHRAYRLEV